MKTKLVMISTLRDGGSTIWIEESDKDSIKTIEDFDNIQEYYIDGRIGSTTKGELYDRNPSKEGAIKLNKDEFEFLENSRSRKKSS